MVVVGVGEDGIQAGRQAFAPVVLPVPETPMTTTCRVALGIPGVAMRPTLGRPARGNLARAGYHTRATQQPAVSADAADAAGCWRTISVVRGAGG